MAVEADWDLVSYVISSDYREAVIDQLGEFGPATPSAIASREDADIPHYSRALQELREKGLVELLIAEETKKGRLYGLTDEGKSAYEGLGTVNLGER